MAIKIKPITTGWLIFIVYTVGFAGFFIPETLSLMRNLIWVNQCFTLIVLFLYHKKWSKEFVISTILIGIAGYFLEVVGTQTGLIFGDYQYGTTLGFNYLKTPIMMFVSWVSVIYLTRQIAEQVTKDPMLHCLSAAILMVLLDYFIEPFAMRQGMWNWNNGIVPIHNYIGWFVSGFIFHYIYLKSAKFPINKLSLPIYLIQLSFFIALYLKNK